MLPPTDPTGLRRLVAYDAWANRRLAAACTDAHPQAIRLLAHACTSERVWLRRMEGAQPTSQATDFWPEVSADALRTLAEEAAEAMQAFTDALSAADLTEREATYRNSKGVDYRTRFGDVLTHVLLHSHYHRGQAAMALREAGTAPPWTDFIAFVRAGG
ncbi:MAG: DinB family protein [Rhodothermales bacterium]|nr:DinB family protein [Rhodothermales bacterium]